jgi:hypothetical protein
MGTENRYIRYAFLSFKLFKILFTDNKVSLNFVRDILTIYFNILYV